MVVRRAVELAGIFREDDGSLGNTLLVVSATVQQFVANAVRQVDGIGTDLSRFLGPAFLERESVRFEVTAVGFCFIDFVTVGYIGNDRLGEKDDFPGFQRRWVALDRGTV